jgi:TRAP-type C4-dicarboxylate transport system permease small subunit
MFNSPLSYTLEVVELAMVVIAFTSMTVCTGKRAHLDIDVLVRKMPKQAQNIVQTIVDILFAGLFAVIAWQAILRTIYLTQTADFSTVLKVPYYPFFGLISICSVLISLFLITQILNRILRTTSQ